MVRTYNLHVLNDIHMPAVFAVYRKLKSSLYQGSSGGIEGGGHRINIVVHLANVSSMNHLWQPQVFYSIHYTGDGRHPGVSHTCCHTNLLAIQALLSAFLLQLGYGGSHSCYRINTFKNQSVRILHHSISGRFPSYACRAVPHVIVCVLRLLGKHYDPNHMAQKLLPQFQNANA